MPHDIFISYSKSDKTQADALCHHLEGEGFRCWIAPRDVEPGTDWTDSISKAIEGSEALLILFSDKSADSRHVKSEVRSAFDRGKILVPMRVSNVQPTGGFDHLLGTSHWVDAFPKPLDKYFDQVTLTLNKLIDKKPGHVHDRKIVPVHKVSPAMKLNIAWWIVGITIFALAGFVLFLPSKPKPENVAEHSFTLEKGIIQPEVMQLSKNEEKALCLVLADQQAGDRGVWAIPLHQQLIYRGLSDVQATVSLSSLVFKGLLISVDVESKHSITNEIRTAPAYKATQKAFKYAAEHENVLKFEEGYKYILRVEGENKKNVPFLKHLENLDFIERESRFIDEEDPSVSRIVIFSYDPISDKLIREIAEIFNVTVLDFSKR